MAKPKAKRRQYRLSMPQLDNRIAARQDAIAKAQKELEDFLAQKEERYNEQLNETWDNTRSALEKALDAKDLEQAQAVLALWSDPEVIDFLINKLLIEADDTTELEDDGEQANEEVVEEFVIEVVEEPTVYEQPVYDNHHDNNAY